MASHDEEPVPAQERPPTNPPNPPASITVLRYSIEDLQQEARDRDQQRLVPLIAELVLEFAEKAVVLLKTTDLQFVVPTFRSDRRRNADLAHVLGGITEDRYEAWGLPPGYRAYLSKHFEEIIDNGSSPSPSSRYLDDGKYALATILLRNFLAEFGYRELSEPMFMFVHGKSLEEMKVLKPCTRSTVWSFMCMREPWVPHDTKQAWREPVKRGRRSGGRTGGNGKGR